MLTDAGFRDAMHDFFGKKEPTMLKSKRFKAWRPDKVVVQATPPNPTKPYWRVTRAEILGKQALPSYRAKNETPDKVAQDGVIRTPSDHFAICADLVYKL